ncbi:MAG: glycosyltransferase family 4 protein [Chloroflexi bacterium]|nr:glycosyltransferase family 4 protein [Chloroflexota bacterium]
MRIALISTTLYNFQGADRVMWQLADQLAKKGDLVTLFSFKGNMLPPTDVDSVTMGMPAGFLAERIFRLTFPLNIFAWLKYARILKEFDMVYTGPYPASWLAYIAKLLYNREYTYYFFHFNLPGFIPGFFARSYSRMHVFLEKWTLKRANKVMTISEFSKRSLANVFNKDIEVVYCTVDCYKFKPGLNRTIIRNKYDLGEQPVILCVGQLIPSKGMHLLIEAFKRVKADFPDAQLIIVGKAVFPGYLKKLRDMAGDSVIFAQDVPAHELPYYYSACDIYATATLWEGFNIPLIEAQACGKPVVAFDIGPHPEVIDNGVTGILVPASAIAEFSSAIIKLLKKKDLAVSLGKHGSIVVRQHFCLNTAPDTSKFTIDD